MGDASTNRDRCCRGGRECPRATGSPRRLVPPSSGSQDRRPSPPSTPSRPLKFSETKQACVHLSSPPDHNQRTRKAEVLVTRYRPASVRHCRQTTIGIGATGRKRAACDRIRALHPSARSAACLEPTASRRRHRVAPDRGDAHFARRSAIAARRIPSIAKRRAASRAVTSSLPVAGFSIIEAASLSEAIDIVSRVPSAVAHGVVEVWPLEQAS